MHDTPTNDLRVRRGGSCTSWYFYYGDHHGEPWSAMAASIYSRGEYGAVANHAIAAVNHHGGIYGDPRGIER